MGGLGQKYHFSEVIVSCSFRPYERQNVILYAINRIIMIKIGC